MKGDFSRLTFDPRDHYTRVLTQQGRVQLDADWNELVDLLVHQHRALASHLIGWHGAPSSSPGFAVSRHGSKLRVSPGLYYVDGILVEGSKTTLELPAEPGKYVVYLEVRERHVTYLQDERLRDPALGGPDTTTRTQVLGVVGIKRLTCSGKPKQVLRNRDRFRAWIESHEATVAPMLKAAVEGPPADDPGETIVPGGYVGLENRLYRVEIHREGDQPTFKWSRDNGADADAVLAVDGSKVRLDPAGRPGGLELQPGDWVELTDDESVLENRADPLLRVAGIDETRKIVILDTETGREIDPGKHPVLRRWNQRTGDWGTTVVEGDGDTAWLNLEHGIRIHFQSPPPGKTARYRTGDYWMIPARSESGDVEWPRNQGEPIALPPHGIERHYAPLALLKVGRKRVRKPRDCRRLIESAAR